jgi:peptidoglycan/LPS O-acetylase OafA/YrhL
LFTYPQQEIAAGLFAGLLLIGLVIAAPAAPLNRLLRLPPIVWLGTISYGLYIYFIPVFILVNIYYHQRGWTNHYYVLLTTQFIVLLVMASLSYYLVEKRFLALKDKLSNRDERHRPQHARGRSHTVRRTVNGANEELATMPAVVPPVQTTLSRLFDNDVPLR